MADETICIHTPTGLVCYQNARPMYSRWDDQNPNGVEITNNVNRARRCRGC